MKNLEALISLVGEAVDPKNFELLDRVKRLKLELVRTEKEYSECKARQEATESMLKSTIEDLKRESQKALKHKDNQLDQIAASMTSSMCYMDSDYIYRYVNPRYEDWYSISSDEVIGKSVRDLAPFLYDMHKSIYDRVIKGETIKNTVDTFLPSGERMVLNVNYVPAYNVDGENTGLYIYSSDVTEIHIKSEALEASQKEIIQKNKMLEQYIDSNLQLEQFAHIAAHDMRAPLRTISSFTGIIEKKLNGLLSEKDKEYVNYIKQGTVSLSNLITDLLDYSKVKSEGISLQRFNPEEMLEQVITFISSSDNPKVKIKIAELPKEIVADKIKIYQVFQNLISNAIKFVDGDIKPIVEVDCVETKEDYIFSVADNGIGIPDDMKEYVFEPFKQLNNKQKFKGTGLGLSICKRIISDHKGTIKVEKSATGGSKFIFTIGKNLDEATVSCKLDPKM